MTPQDFVRKFDEWVKPTTFRCVGYSVQIDVTEEDAIRFPGKLRLRAEGSILLTSKNSQPEHCSFRLDGDAAELFSDAMLERFKQAVRDYAERWGRVLES